MTEALRLPDTLWMLDIASTDGLVRGLMQATQQSLSRWPTEQFTDVDARWLSVLIENKLLTADGSIDGEVSQLLKNYLRLESEIPVARRSPGVFEDHCPVNQEVLGSHHEDYSPSSSGRLQLAEAIASRDNPLTARVYVNRVWHWMFGRGIVATVDNFGRMGQTPSHPELLDDLARQFIDNGWSTKKLIRGMALSRTWQRDSIAAIRPIAFGRMRNCNVWMQSRSAT
jgi:hypothetical protein